MMSAATRNSSPSRIARPSRSRELRVAPVFALAPQLVERVPSQAPEPAEEDDEDADPLDRRRAELGALDEPAGLVLGEQDGDHAGKLPRPIVLPSTPMRTPIPRHRGFTMLDALLLTSFVVIGEAILLSMLGTRCGFAPQMQSSTQLRGIHQGIFTFAQANKRGGRDGFYPGLDWQGNSLLVGDAISAAELAAAADVPGYAASATDHVLPGEMNATPQQGFLTRASQNSPPATSSPPAARLTSSTRRTRPSRSSSPAAATPSPPPTSATPRWTFPAGMAKLPR